MINRHDLFCLLKSVYFWGKGVPLTTSKLNEISLGKCAFGKTTIADSTLNFNSCAYANCGFRIGITMKIESLEQQIAKQEER
jgi:hypothetical protein